MPKLARIIIGGVMGLLFSGITTGVFSAVSTASLNIHVENEKVAISGYAKYFSNETPINDTKCEISNNEISVQSDTTGFYEFDQLEIENNYIINVSKLANTDVDTSDITMFDVALAARAAVNLDTLESDYIIAADADKNSLIQMYDASMIAHYAVGLSEEFAGSHVGNWYFSPDSFEYSPLLTDQNNQDFTGLVIGDVDGSWGEDTLSKNSMPLVEFDTEFKLSKGQTDISFPLFLKPNSEMLSLLIEIEFDHKTVNYTGFSKTELLENFSSIVNDESPGKLVVGLFSTTHLNKSGQILSFSFSTLSLEEKITIKRIQVNNYPAQTGQINVTSLEENASNLPKSYELLQSYPNPFSPHTKSGAAIISYQLPEESDVELVIYNFLGQTVAEIVNTKQKPGYYKVSWSGRQSLHKVLPTGLYFYQLKTPKYTKVRKMLLVH